MLKRSLVLMLLICDAAIPSEAPSEEGSRIMIMLETEIIPGKKLKGPPEEYKSDGNPKTIELVTLRPSDDGPSRVSEDGEVVFLRDPKAATNEFDALLEKAFDIRMARRREKT
jgi:hypothetical protein